MQGAPLNHSCLRPALTPCVCSKHGAQDAWSTSQPASPSRMWPRMEAAWSVSMESALVGSSSQVAMVLEALCALLSTPSCMGEQVQQPQRLSAINQGAAALGRSGTRP